MIIYIMYYRDNKGVIKYLDVDKKNNDKEMYKELWSKKYNIKLKTKNYGHNNKLISYIRNDKNYV